MSNKPGETPTGESSRHMSQSEATRVLERAVSKSGAPDWAKGLIVVALPMVMGVVGYGEIKGEMVAKVAALEQRVARVEESADKDRDLVRKAVEDMRVVVGNVQLDVARICVKVKCDR